MIPTSYSAIKVIDYIYSVLFHMEFVIILYLKGQKKKTSIQKGQNSPIWNEVFLGCFGFYLIQVQHLVHYENRLVLGN